MSVPPRNKRMQKALPDRWLRNYRVRRAIRDGSRDNFIPAARRSMKIPRDAARYSPRDHLGFFLDLLSNENKWSLCHSWV